MKHIKRFHETESEQISEMTGALVIGGLLLSFVAPAIYNTAKHAINKWLMEKRYKQTGQKVMVPYKGKEIAFDKVIDKQTNEEFWGLSYVDDTNEGNEQYLLYDKKGFENLKKTLQLGKDPFDSGSLPDSNTPPFVSKSWSKTPSLAPMGQGKHGN